MTVVLGATFKVEEGATVVSELRGQDIPLDEHYFPIEAEVQFYKPGVFTGSVQILVQVGDVQLGEERLFWLRHTEDDTALITYEEYREQRLREIAANPLDGDPNLDLEPGELPGVATTTPDECAQARMQGVPCPE